MEALQMFELFSVRSNVNGAYSVEFSSNLDSILSSLGSDPNHVFIIDSKIPVLFSDHFAPILASSRYVLVESSETNKTVDYAMLVIKKLIEVNVRKNDCLIAVGGGITQDIVAFISSILYRGIEWKYLPTTLLAQCDSCIGSKSSINFDQYKNLLGTFNPPQHIYIFHGFLATLSDLDIKSGIGEMLHYFFYEGIELAEKIAEQYQDLITNRNGLPYFIVNSLRIKRSIIELDEFDTSIRHVFNYGHTFGHAIEAITNYNIVHGQAISIGMDIANYISMSKGWLPADDFKRMHTILEKNMPPFLITPENIEAYCTALSKDKKNKGNQLGCILSHKPGNLEKTFIDMDADFRQILLSYSSC